MEYQFLLLIGLARALGFKQSYDADHLVAASILTAGSKDLTKTSWMSARWAVGHMLTAGVIAISMKNILHAG